MTSLAVLASLFAGADDARGGLIFVSQGAFDAAAASLGLAWAEDFESFAIGGVPDPLLIAGGQAEVVDGGSTSIISITPTGKAWLKSGGSPGQAIVRGPGGSSLGVKALSFNFGNEVAGAWDFAHSLGAETSPGYGANGGSTNRFVGWIGGVGETLDFTRYNQTAGITMDNVRGFKSSVVPEPSSIVLFAMGTFGVALIGRRRKQKLVA